MTPMLLLLTLWLFGRVDSQISLRGSRFDDSAIFIDDWHWRNGSSSGSSRKLQEGPKSFRPLDCNAVKCGKGTTTWKTLGLNPAANPVVIPCGMCVTMDFDASPFLELTYGLDIQGTLIFPNASRLTLKTPFILVQGNLELDSLRTVSDDPDVKFLFTGKNQQSFLPADNNKFICSADGATTPSRCRIGFKSFVVAGGRVTIRGLNGSCVTWTKLHDIARGGSPVSTVFEALPVKFVRSDSPFCHSWTYMQEDFSSTNNPYGWTGGYGALFQVTNGTFRVSGRKSSLEHGPTWDMLWVRECLIPKQKYLFSARVKLSKFGTKVDDRTSCAVSNENCLTLFSSVRTPSGRIGRAEKAWEKARDIRYGKWYDFDAVFEFDVDELSPDNFYQILQLRGPEAGVDIEIDDVRFSLPDPTTLPDPLDVCGGNLILNGDAEAHSINPYPVGCVGGFLTVEEEDSGNRYFRHSGRTSSIHSPIYSFTAQGCLAANARYSLSVSLRINSAVPMQILVEIRSEFTNSTNVQRILLSCLGVTRDAWKVCSTEVSLQPELLGATVKDIRIQFETIGGATLDMDVDNMTFELLDAAVTSLIVPSVGIVDCWGKGVDVLITSHTLHFNDSQVRTLTANPTSVGNGFVRLDLNEAIVQPITKQDSPNFAVEIALLSRNILFEGDADPLDSLLGAHFMVMQTPAVAQLIDGAEFRNFGQQGVLGRYPIHFHLCGDANGAIVKRNTIRNSKQRCIVLHGSNGAYIVDNIAFDTRGHCYMLEDGGEIDNTFARNLGAKTQKATRPVSALETDHLLPSTFWCTNPQNSWIENVAAGSSDSGFWFELNDAVRGLTATMPHALGMVPRTMRLGDFRENVAHSNGKHGIRTYPHGYLPSIEAAFKDNLSFRNMGDGFFLRNSNNIAVTGGVLADNAIQIDIDRAGAIRVEGTAMIGLSDSFRRSIGSKPGVVSHSGILVGIQLHGKSFFDEGGALVRSVSFSSFASSASKYVALIDVDDDDMSNSFDYPASLSGIKIEGDVTPFRFNFTKALARGVNDVYAIDLTSGMKPNGSNATGVSSVVANSNMMKTFLTKKDCEIFSASGYMYCFDTCIRTLIYSVNPSVSADYKLRVTNEAGLFVDVVGGFFEDPVELKNDSLQTHRRFVASLPLGSYRAFFHAGDGVSVWPTHAEESLLNVLCENSIDANDVQLEIPVASISECEQLVRNGNIEDSSLLPNYWLQNEGGMQVIYSGGIGGTNAIADVIWNSETGSIGQFLDTRCLQRGRQYEVQAWVKLTVGSSVVSCDSATNCPVARIGLRSPGNTTMSSSFSELKLDVASAFARPYNLSGWNMLHGTFSVDARVQAASSVSFFVERRRIGASMMLDNVSVRMIPQSCNQLVFNGDFTEGTSKFWTKSVPKDSLTLIVKKIQENWALEMSGRSSAIESPRQDIRINCLVAGARYLATAKFKLLSSTGTSIVCNPSFVVGLKACPRMVLRSLSDVGLPTQMAVTREGTSIAVTDHGMTSDGWYTMTGVFSASKFDEKADRLDLSWDQVSDKGVFILDDVSLIPLSKNCTELILNGDLEYDETPRFWRMWMNGGGKITEVNDGAGNHAMAITNRVATGDGIYQFVDPVCLKGSGVWRFSARMKIVSNSTGLGVACQPAETGISKACPPIRITGWNGTTIVVDKIQFMTNRLVWSPNSYNTYATDFAVDSILANCDRIAIGVRQYNLDWNLLIDNVSVMSKVP